MDEQDRDNEGLKRTMRRVERKYPGRFAHFLHWIRQPAARWVRIPLALALIGGGFLGFVPLLGFWMLPLGLVVLALDLPLLRRPMRRLIVCSERRWRKHQWTRRRRHESTAQAGD